MSSLKSIPVRIALGVILLVCLVRLVRLELFERLERITFDMRAREALKFPSPLASNLAFVFIDEKSIDFVRTNDSLGYRAGLYWPRHVYGRALNELAAQGARAVAFDIIFAELRHDHPSVQVSETNYQESDEFFAEQLRRSSNAILAATQDRLPVPWFLTNSMAAGDISIEKDRPEGILRRSRAFRLHRFWHPLFEQAQTDLGFDLGQAKVEKRRIVLRRSDGQQVTVPLDKNGTFSVADFVGDKLPPGMPPRARPFTDERIWSLGIVLAAQQLGLDLDHAQVDLKHGLISLRGANGVQRAIPVDRDGNFCIDWCVPPSHPRLARAPIQLLLEQNHLRLEGTNNLPRNWAGKLVVVGSSALGNDLTDRGATPLEEDTLYVSKHWNVANSLLTGRFVQRSPLTLDLVCIAVLGALAAIFTWQIRRVLLASTLVVFMAALYVGFAIWLYVHTRYWLPLVLPVTGGALMNYACLLTWRVRVEQAEVRRVKSIFSKVVSPKIMKELLHAETLSLEGVRREVTVLFTDVRGFTALTDTAQERAAELVKQRGLTGEQAEAAFGEGARDILKNINLYLGMVADIIIQQDGTWDKFIGDCVMAFWGAPTPNPIHAVSCVRAAIEAQRAVHDLNQQRAAENRSLELENKARVSAGLPAKPLLPLLMLGTGINTGVVTAGLMGSQAEQKNYTVFGREVNLASRLEGLSGHGRIFISASTYQHLVRDDPALAATCIAQPPQKVKGFATAVNVYEVPWRLTTFGRFEREPRPATTLTAADAVPSMR